MKEIFPSVINLWNKCVFCVYRPSHFGLATVQAISSNMGEAALILNSAVLDHMTEIPSIKNDRVKYIWDLRAAVKEMGPNLI